MIISIVSASDVDDLRTFEAYVHQRLGTPFSTVADRARLGKTVKTMMEKHPRATWRTMCRIVDWAADHHKRPGRSYEVMFYAENAWKARYIPEIDEDPERDVLLEVEKILAVETDQEWRDRVMFSEGSVRAQAVREWHDVHQPKTQPKKRTRQPKQLTLPDPTAQEKPKRARRTRTS